MTRLVFPIILIAAGLIYLLLTLQIPLSKTGNPHAPQYFPALIGTFLVIISSVYLAQEWKKRKEKLEELKGLLTGRTPYLIGSSLALILVYILLFERIGFLFSTMIFLTSMLFVVNGRYKWKQNMAVGIIFSIMSWYAFAQLLQVSLP
ncbi:tripartite tricarboxylate transporter TctB family protein [Salibacterium halotolerans]|uniref:Putative tricarboxylic transport membrane protein n=1 Tax=Salibacterium halotolerans TaxID=1884432 RepID=A0A1I5RMV7_9BACI|nr:tripartite tricarboxylate transporter TctB family protein [Salibacterium halotolerans]SFP59879.1 putative tricarboxylic transport membrane protein [Salibacterium halotolerans]